MTILSPSKRRDLRSRRERTLALMIGALLTAACTGGMDTSEALDTRTSAIQQGQAESGFPAVGDVLTSTHVVTGGGSGSGSEDAEFAICTGVLVHPSYILTASHCVPLTSFRIGTSLEDFVTIPIDRWFPHPDMGTDLVLAHLETPILNITPIPYNVDPSVPAIGESCTAVGFGWHTESDGSTTVNVKRSCTELVESVNAGTIAVVKQSGIADHGDSGGPLLCRGAIAGLVRNHTDGNYPSHSRENYTPIDVAWMSQVLAGNTDILFRVNGGADNGKLTISPLAGNKLLEPWDIIFAQPPNVVFQGVGDFDGDGRSDILLRTNDPSGSWKFTVWTMAGGTVLAQHDLFTSTSSLVFQGIGDFDGDGKSEILLRRTDADGRWRLQEWSLSGVFGWPRPELFTQPPNVEFQGIGDFDGDGKSDILLRNNDANGNWRFVQWKMNGNDAWPQPDLFTQPPNVVFQGIGDLDGDGKSDILLRNNAANGTWRFAEWKMSGNAVWAPPELPIQPPNVSFQGIADFNGDGKSDILLRNDAPNGSSTYAEWWMSNETVFSAPEFVVAPNLTFQGLGTFFGRSPPSP